VFAISISVTGIYSAPAGAGAHAGDAGAAMLERVGRMRLYR